MRKVIISFISIGFLLCIVGNAYGQTVRITKGNHLAAEYIIAFLQMERCVRTNDYEGFSLLIESGQIFTPKKGIEVRIIDVNTFKNWVKLRVVGHEHLEFWTFTDEIK